MPQQPFPFFDLPPEIRNQILLHLILSPNPIHIHALSPTYPSSLLLVSSQLHAEVLPLYFQSNNFVLFLQRHNLSLNPFLSSRSRYLVRSLHIAIERWGANDFFVRDFAPVLEDMILNGALRRLEVGVLEGFAKRFEKEEEEGLQGGNGRVVRVLRRILSDPYLEAARLVSFRRGDKNCFETRDVVLRFGVESKYWFTKYWK